MLFGQKRGNPAHPFLDGWIAGTTRDCVDIINPHQILTTALLGTTAVDTVLAGMAAIEAEDRCARRGLSTGLWLTCHGLSGPPIAH